MLIPMLWLELSCYKRSWLIFIIKLMLIYIRRKVEGWTIPVRCFVPFESPRSRVPGIVFLDERA